MLKIAAKPTPGYPLKNTYQLEQQFMQGDADAFTKVTIVSEDPSVIDAILAFYEALHELEDSKDWDRLENFFHLSEHAQKLFLKACLKTGLSLPGGLTLEQLNDPEFEESFYDIIETHEDAFRDMYFQSGLVKYDWDGDTAMTIYNATECFWFNSRGNRFKVTRTPGPVIKNEPPPF